jgi:hypothetical protein
MLNVISGTLSSGAPPVSPTSYESISTVSVGSGGSSSISFTSIPSSYTHLQVRAISKNSSSGNTNSVLSLNGNAIGYRHYIYGDGSSTGAGAAANGEGVMSATSTAANVFGVFVMDVLDYTNTNKNKTVRVLQGVDANGSGVVSFNSFLYSTNTNAITSLTLTSSGTNFVQYSSFALYGIKG